jgi:hypothetical protein
MIDDREYEGPYQDGRMDGDADVRRRAKAELVRQVKHNQNQAAETRGAQKLYKKLWPEPNVRSRQKERTP